MGWETPRAEIATERQFEPQLARPDLGVRPITAESNLTVDANRPFLTGRYPDGHDGRRSGW